MSKIPLYHFTHIANLQGIVSNGLIADNFISPNLYVNSGNQEIKDNRKKKFISPNRCVGDYVPFYFAPRSPMMYSQKCKGNIRNEDIIYLVTYAEDLVTKYEWCCSNINAAINYACFYDNWDDMLCNIDWEVMKSKYWFNDQENPNRKERRMAEFLVYNSVEIIDFCGIATYSEKAKNEIYNNFSSHFEIIIVRPDWYF